MFRFAAGGVGGAANKNDRKFLVFAPRELVERGRGASVIRQNPADFVRNTFELRPIHTAVIHISFNEHLCSTIVSICTKGRSILI